MRRTWNFFSTLPAEIISRAKRMPISVELEAYDARVEVSPFTNHEPIALLRDRLIKLDPRF